MAAFLLAAEAARLAESQPSPTAKARRSPLSDLRGKVVLLNIWATWCVPCREEMPMLDKLEAELGGKDFQVVAVNIDRGGGDKATAFLAETGATHLALYTDPSGKLFSKIKAVGMPTTLLIDREGREIGRLVGPADWDSPEALALIRRRSRTSAKPFRLRSVPDELRQHRRRFCISGSRNSRRRIGAAGTRLSMPTSPRASARSMTSSEAGVPPAWLDTPKGVLAAILVLDQFPRNMFRGDARAFATDASALALAKRAIAEGFDVKLTPRSSASSSICRSSIRRIATDQARAIELFAALGKPLNLDFALRHQAVVDRFGRFPASQRAARTRLDRAGAAFLKQPGSSF